MATKAKKTNGQAERDELGLTKTDKANITRISRDLAAAEPYASMKHLSAHRIKKAIIEDKVIRDLIAKHNTMVWRQGGFDGKIDSLIAAIPVSARRPKMSPEERAKYEKRRREALLDTAGDGPVNEFSRHALKISFLQGLSGDDREKAKAVFEKKAVQLEA